MDHVIVIGKILVYLEKMILKLYFLCSLELIFLVVKASKELVTE